MMSHPCPFNNIEFVKSLLPMKLHKLEEIEKHATAASNSCSHHPLKDVVFVGGSTPLILACQFGELESVVKLIEDWGVDVEASAKYFSDPAILNSSKIRIGEANPLFVAAFHGHSRIVRYLLERGADVSVKIIDLFSEFDRWTPLQGAFSNVQNDSQKPLLEQHEERNTIVRDLLEFGANPKNDILFPFGGTPVWAESMCGSNLIAVLINRGLNLKQRNLQTGQTLLHHVICRFAEEDSLMSLVALLVDKGADLMDRDCEGFTPLLTAAKELKLAVLDYLLERDEYSRTEKMNALELAGATILLEAPSSLFLKAFDYWRRAHQLRQLVRRNHQPLGSTFNRR